MKVEDAIEWIHSRLPFGSRPGLDRVKALVQKVGNPEQQLPVIHVAGTNGKGSTVAYLRSLLMESGLTVGSFTSPYIESFNERIAIDGKHISDQELVKLVEKYQGIISEMDTIPEISGITEFETLTAMALDYFVEKKVDIAVVEVGLGGLLDSTNVVKPLLTVITTIGLDHTDILGDTLEEIAAQKAGIIKEKIPVVTGNITSEALAVIDAAAAAKHAPAYHFAADYHVHYLHPDAKWGEVFDYLGEGGKLTKLLTPLVGRHQVENAGVAIEAYYRYCQLKKLPFQERNVRQGLLKTYWPARMEKISTEPFIVLDGAHNAHAMRRLVENVNKEFKGYQVKVLFSALTTKNVSEMLHLLRKIPNVQIYLTTFDYPKAIDLEKFNDLDYDNVTIVSLWQFGLAEILGRQSSTELLLVTGSLYFVSKVRELLLGLGDSDED